MYCRISLGHHSHYVTSEGMFFQTENVKIQTVPTTNCKKVFFKIKNKSLTSIFKKYFLCPLQNKIVKMKKLVTGTDATALKKKFRWKLDYRFGFTPFYGTDPTEPRSISC